MTKNHLLVIATIIVFAITLWITLYGPGILYSEGTRSGVVTKISNKGVLFKTNEGELSLQRNTNVDGQIITDVFYFSVEEEKIVNDIRDAEKSGDRITLRYKEYILRGYYKGMTPYNVIGVE